jgi:hypothetical protein
MKEKLPVYKRKPNMKNQGGMKPTKTVVRK